MALRGGDVWLCCEGLVLKKKNTSSPHNLLDLHRNIFFASQEYGLYNTSNRAQLVVYIATRRRYRRLSCDWSSDVCSSDLIFFFQAEDGIRDYRVTGVQRVLFR